jgi:site-specific recombinase XerD
MKPITFSQAVEGYLLQARAERLSDNTLRNYELAFRRFAEWLGNDPPIATITPEQIAAFLADLARPRPLPGIAPRPEKGLSRKTALNYHGALSALWTWALREHLVERHVVKVVPRPRPEKRAITPFTRDDVRALLASLDRSRSYRRPGKRVCDHSRPTAARDRAIILLLLDTGMRAGELAALCVRDVDLKNRRLIVFGKGAKERVLYFSSITGKAIWRYLSERGDVAPGEPLFASINGRPLGCNALLQLLRRLGRKAGVPDCHPHRFRHTFAINFLRNGGNIYELQMALGHSTLEMVKTYLNLAQTDLETAHRRASPVENWRL